MSYSGTLKQESFKLISQLNKRNYDMSNLIEKLESNLLDVLSDPSDPTSTPEYLGTWDSFNILTDPDQVSLISEAFEYIAPTGSQFTAMMNNGDLITNIKKVNTITYTSLDDSRDVLNAWVAEYRDNTGSLRYMPLFGQDSTNLSKFYFNEYIPCTSLISNSDNSYEYGDEFGKGFVTWLDVMKGGVESINMNQILVDVLTENMAVDYNSDIPDQREVLDNVISRQSDDATNSANFLQDLRTYMENYGLTVLGAISKLYEDIKNDLSYDVSTGILSFTNEDNTVARYLLVTIFKNVGPIIIDIASLCLAIIHPALSVVGQIVKGLILAPWKEAFESTYAQRIKNADINGFYFKYGTEDNVRTATYSEFKDNVGNLFNNLIGLGAVISHMPGYSAVMKGISGDHRESMGIYFYNNLSYYFPPSFIDLLVDDGWIHMSESGGTVNNIVINSGQNHTLTEWLELIETYKVSDSRWKTLTNDYKAIDIDKMNQHRFVSSNVAFIIWMYLSMAQLIPDADRDTYIELGKWSKGNIKSDEDPITALLYRSLSFLRSTTYVDNFWSSEIQKNIDWYSESLQDTFGSLTDYMFYMLVGNNKNVLSQSGHYTYQVKVKYLNDDLQESTYYMWYGSTSYSISLALKFFKNSMFFDLVTPASISGDSLLLKDNYDAVLQKHVSFSLYPAGSYGDPIVLASATVAVTAAAFAFWWFGPRRRIKAWDQSTVLKAENAFKNASVNYEMYLESGQQQYYDNYKRLYQEYRTIAWKHNLVSWIWRGTRINMNPNLASLASSISTSSSDLKDNVSKIITNNNNKQLGKKTVDDVYYLITQD